MLEIPILLHLRVCHLLKHKVGVGFFVSVFWGGGSVCLVGWVFGVFSCGVFYI